MKLGCIFFFFFFFFSCLPSASTTGKYRWCFFITVISTSFGRRGFPLDEIPTDGGRLLHQVGDLVQQAGIVRVPPSTSAANAARLRFDRSLPHVPIHDDVVGGDQRQIRIGAGDFKFR